MDIKRLRHQSPLAQEQQLARIVPFSFTVNDTTFPAGEYEVRQPTQFILALRNVENQASAMEHVEPASSEAGGERENRLPPLWGGILLGGNIRWIVAVNL
jgi:hypothetical protein